MANITFTDDQYEEVIDFCKNVIIRKQQEPSASAQRSVETYSNIIRKLSENGTLTDRELAVVLNGSNWFADWNDELSQEVFDLLPLSSVNLLKEAGPNKRPKPKTKRKPIAQKRKQMTIEDLVIENEFEAIQDVFNIPDTPPAQSTLSKEDVEDAVFNGIKRFFSNLK